MPTLKPPLDLARWLSRGQRREAEHEALERALAYADADPYYEGKPVSTREEALMRLALRAFTEPYDTIRGAESWRVRNQARARQERMSGA